MAILFAFQCAGLGLHAAGVPLPGTVLGLLLLALALFTGAVPVARVETTAGLLLGHMPLFFAPVIVVAGGELAALRGQLVAILASVVVSLLAVLLTTGLISQRLLGPARKDADD